MDDAVSVLAAAAAALADEYAGQRLRTDPRGLAGGDLVTPHMSYGLTGERENVRQGDYGREFLFERRRNPTCHVRWWCHGSLI